MKGIDWIKRQLNALESRTGIITLPNGTHIRGKDLIILYGDMERIKAETKRGLLISDFSQEGQQRIRGLSLWEPHPSQGAIAIYLVEQSKIILKDSFGISFNKGQVDK